MDRLNHDSNPGRYRVDTCSGATYLITIETGRPATMRRTRTAAITDYFSQSDLYGDEGDIELSTFTFTVGSPGVLMFWDEAAREHPGYLRVEAPYRGTRRLTTPVKRIEAVGGPDGG